MFAPGFGCRDYQHPAFGHRCGGPRAKQTLWTLQRLELWMRGAGDGTMPLLQDCRSMSWRFLSTRPAEAKCSFSRKSRPKTRFPNLAIRGKTSPTGWSSWHHRQQAHSRTRPRKGTNRGRLQTVCESESQGWSPHVRSHGRRRRSATLNSSGKMRLAVARVPGHAKRSSLRHQCWASPRPLATGRG